MKLRRTKGHYALCFKTRASFGAHHENWCQFFGPPCTSSAAAQLVFHTGRHNHITPWLYRLHCFMRRNEYHTSLPAWPAHVLQLVGDLPGRLRHLMYRRHPSPSATKHFPSWQQEREPCLATTGNGSWWRLVNTLVWRRRWGHGLDLLGSRDCCSSSTKPSYSRKFASHELQQSRLVQGAPWDVTGQMLRHHVVNTDGQVSCATWAAQNQVSVFGTLVWCRM